jgi:hypothetical protein
MVMMVMMMMVMMTIVVIVLPFQIILVPILHIHFVLAIAPVGVIALDVGMARAVAVVALVVGVVLIVVAVVWVGGSRVVVRVAKRGVGVSDETMDHGVSDRRVKARVTSSGLQTSSESWSSTGDICPPPPRKYMEPHLPVPTAKTFLQIILHNHLLALSIRGLLARRSRSVPIPVPVHGGHTLPIPFQLLLHSHELCLFAIEGEFCLEERCETRREVDPEVVRSYTGYTASNCSTRPSTGAGPWAGWSDTESEACRRVEESAFSYSRCRTGYCGELRLGEFRELVESS